MPGADVEPLPPEAFAAGWLVAAVALTVLAALVAAWPWLRRLWQRWRRREPPPAGPPSEAVMTAGEMSRRQALERIGQIEQQWQAGELTDRSAAYEIAQTVRQFTGTEAAVLTLLELRQRGHLKPLTALIQDAYPVEFGVAGKGDIGQLAERARQAVGP